MKNKAKTTKFMKNKTDWGQTTTSINNSKLFRFKESTVLKID